MHEMRLQYIVTTPAAKRIFFVTLHIFIATLRHYKHANAMYYVSISQPCCQPVFQKKLPGRQFFSFIFEVSLVFAFPAPLLCLSFQRRKGLTPFLGASRRVFFWCHNRGREIFTSAGLIYSLILAKIIRPAEVWSTLVTATSRVCPMRLLAFSTTIIVPSSR